MPWCGLAGKARHTGVSIPVWEREGEALGVLTNRKTGAISPLATRYRQRYPCKAQRSRMVCVRSCVPAPVGQGERVPTDQLKKAAPSGAGSAGQSASLTPPTQSEMLLIVTRMGRD